MSLEWEVTSSWLCFQTLPEEGEPIADRLNQALRKPYFTSVIILSSCQPVLACVNTPTMALTAKSLIRNADTAMYHAKRNGRDQYRILCRQMTHEVNDLIENQYGASSGHRQ